MQAMVPDYDKVWYDDKSIANIFSLTNLVKKYIVTYKSNKDDTFTVCTNRGFIKLRRNKRRLYVFKPTYTTENSNVVTTVEVNVVGFTSRKIERSKSAMKIFSNVGLPTVNKFKHMVSTNIISKCPMEVADRINAENMYGPLMEGLKGKSTRIKPRPVIKYGIKIPSKIYKNN